MAQRAGGVLSQSAKSLGRATKSPYFSNTCAKYGPPGCEFFVFLEHVCKVRASWLRNCSISRTRVQSAGVIERRGGLSPKGFLEVVIGDEQKMKKYEKPLVLLLFQACTAPMLIANNLPGESLDCFRPQEGFIGNGPRAVTS